MKSFGKMIGMMMRLIMTFATSCEPSLWLPV